MLAERIHTEDHWILFYSSVQTEYSGRYSYLAHRLASRVECASFSDLEHTLHTPDTLPLPVWFGYLGYGLKDSIETLRREENNWLTMPLSHFMRFHCLYIFDHVHKTITRWSDDPQDAPISADHSPLPAIPNVVSIRSHMCRSEYLDHVQRVIEHIHAGDLYQANLTRKFIGEFVTPPNGFSIFKKICHVSPAPYSAFLKMGDTCVISSSPERFLTIAADGKMIARPIKGTAPRFADLTQDALSRAQLENSDKDHAENLMIVDLMRNDLARCCVPGSVHVDALCEVTTHATIHHLSSTISGQKRDDCSTLSAIKHCFPPGSMTGAPKIKAMNLCAELERYARGVYSGAIGWFGGDGSCDLSVVIRTLILKDTHFEFQVGGGIVADSTPEKELEETLQKAKGLLLTLSIDETSIRDL